MGQRGWCGVSLVSLLVLVLVLVVAQRCLLPRTPLWLLPVLAPAPSSPTAGRLWVWSLPFPLQGVRGADGELDDAPDLVHWCLAPGAPWVTSAALLALAALRPLPGGLAAALATAACRRGSSSPWPLDSRHARTKPPQSWDHQAQLRRPIPGGGLGADLRAGLWGLAPLLLDCTQRSAARRAELDLCCGSSAPQCRWGGACAGAGATMLAKGRRTFFSVLGTGSRRSVETQRP